MDPFAELARIADDIKRALDGDRVAPILGTLRRQLDLAFARVLDREPDALRRLEFVDGYSALSSSLDDLERLRPA